MAKLIGTAPNQVPTNADLGSLAYMDKDNFDANITELTLGAIARQINSTANDVFIYDTRKDSDGGAWRKRTQTTSWYNEGPSVTRGSRKDFPAVAVIVVEDETVTIYDGDDPDLPMWMVFQSGNYYFLGPTNRLKTSVHMLNGILCIGTANNNAWLAYVSFVDDTARQYSSVTSEQRQYLVPISYRNLINSGNVINSLSKYAIVNSSIRDVTMRVLENAPIDDATGLPIPTIAVATDGGIDVIHPNNQTATLRTYGSYTAVSIDFSEKYLVGVRDGGGSSYLPFLWLHSNLEENATPDLVALRDKDTYPTTNTIHPVAAASTYQRSFTAKDKMYVRTSSGNSYQKGLYVIQPNFEDISSSLACFINTECNSGWLVGNCKIATLADTDDTSVTGSELVSNGTFDTNTTGWTAYGSGHHSFSVVDQKLSVSRASFGSGGGEPYQAIVTDVGKTYVLSLEVGTTTMSVVLETSIGSGSLTGTGNYGVGKHSITFVATTNVTYLRFLPDNSNTTSTVDNVSIRIAEKDRSGKNRAAQVFGPVTKTKVATGAELVAYSNFTNSTTFIQQPHIPDNEIGANDACSMIWFKTTASGVSEMLISFEGEAYDCAFNIRKEVDNTINGWATSDGFATNISVSSGTVYNNDNWHHACWVKRGTTYTLYIDGEFKGSAVYTNDLNYDSNDEKITIGRRTRLQGDPFYGVLALARFSLSAPSPEQIRQIYEDEKVLFRDDAQASIYGSTEVIQALAYDEEYETLHVGTDHGRSVYRGLRRIENTTTPVEGAISASSGMVVEG